MFRILTGKPLPCNLSDHVLCVDQALADTVYRLGNWEYSFQWRDAVNSTLYSALHYGAFMLELKNNLESVINGSDRVIYRYVGFLMSIQCSTLTHMLSPCLDITWHTMVQCLLSWVSFRSQRWSGQEWVRKSRSSSTKKAAASFTCACFGVEDLWKHLLHLGY